MQGYVVVTRRGQAVTYEGRLVRFGTQAEAVPYAFAGDSIVPFDPALHHDRPELRSVARKG